MGLPGDSSGPKRFIGLDVGDKRVGFAFANYLGVGSCMVVPGGFLQVKSIEESVEEIATFIEEDGPDEIVVGLPLDHGNPTRQSDRIMSMAKQLQERLPKKPMHFWDESLTSVAAGELLVDAELKHSGQKKKGRVDADWQDAWPRQF